MCYKNTFRLNLSLNGYHHPQVSGQFTLLVCGSVIRQRQAGDGRIGQAIWVGVRGLIWLEGCEAM